jgi:hypothetical protein
VGKSLSDLVDGADERFRADAKSARHAQQMLGLQGPDSQIACARNL